MLTSRVWLPELSFTAWEWFYEVASHPVSGLLHWLGEPSAIKSNTDGNAMLLNFYAGVTPITVNFSVGGEPGIYHELELAEQETTWQVKGEYRPGSPWRYSPIYTGQTSITDGEYLDSDCWLRANQRALLLAIEHFEGQLSLAEAENQGAFGLKKALWLERLMG
jgi:dTDP-4-dehydrorhamnose reductase